MKSLTYTHSHVKSSAPVSVVFIFIHLHVHPHFQIRIFYGARANAEFLIHSGFVYPENKHDYLAVKLGE